MAYPHHSRPQRPWLPFAKVGIVLVVIVVVAFGLLEVAQRYFGLQKLIIEQVSISGCRGDRQSRIQGIVEPSTLGKPLFWFDVAALRNKVEKERWVKGVIIRRDPPDRLSLVIEERKPLLWLVKPSGVYLISDDGVVLDRINEQNSTPIPVVYDPASQSDENLVKLIRAASELRDKQSGFFSRLTELRWEERGPVAYIEGLYAPLYLSKTDIQKNIPNFQGLFLDQLAKSPNLSKLRYVDLRWDDEIAVGEPQENAPPAQKTLP
ncbi:MAG: FtsQ-type POTRA domain-containing protein [Acidobacteriota bacterium]|nr:FtsQ-type POTRA domain-containing protein [Acidobacteriota bacterium]